MKPRKTAPRRKPTPAASAAVPNIDDAERIVARPDGYHWVGPDGRQEFGPFSTIDEALADMASIDDEGTALPGDGLQDAERDIGIADWIDPETGEPAEGQSPPHFEQE